MAEPLKKTKEEHMEELLAQPLLARLATSNPRTNQPHVVPLWYAWDGESLWMSGFRSTRKIRELQNNPLCSVVIDTTENEMNNYGVLFEGQAELIDRPRELVYDKTTWIYTRYLGPQGVLEPDPQSWIHDPENLLIKLLPRRTFTWFPG